MLQRNRAFVLNQLCIFHWGMKNAKNATTLVVVALLFSGCATPGKDPVSVTEMSKTLKTFAAERDALRPLAASAAGNEFLDAVALLPTVTPRTIYREGETRRWLSPTAFNALPLEKRAGYKPEAQDEERYYSTFYGSPLAYLRALDVAAEHGLTTLAHAKVLDYGYGAMGAVRLMASAGASVTGVDVDSYLSALYHAPGDAGAIKNSKDGSGQITLIHGRFPNDSSVRTKVDAGYDLILSKNTLKNGFVRPRSGQAMIPLDMSAEEYLAAFADTLRRGGLFVIYNIGAAPREDRYLPSTDIASPFTEREYEAAGFKVLAFNKSDDRNVRKMGDALGWAKQMGELNANLYASYTVLQKVR
jgi:SAM-dependent methyltransferase